MMSANGIADRQMEPEFLTQVREQASQAVLELLIHATSSGRDSFSFNSGTMMLISLEYSMSLLLVS